MTSHDPTVLPPGLPVPLDDGAADHLPGQAIPALTLPATTGDQVGRRGHARASLTLVARAGRVVHVFYPVFPPDRNAAEVAAWLRRHPA